MKNCIVALILLFASSPLWADTSIAIKRVSASSVYPADSASYEPSNAIDNKDSTAWFPERTSKANKGEWIKLEFTEPSFVSGITVTNGWVQSRRNWSHNSRIKTAIITLSSGVTEYISLEDSMNAQNIPLPVSEATWLTLTIDEIYPGDRWNQESGITQIDVLGTTKEAMRIAALREEKEAEKARIAQLSAKKQAQEKAEYLVQFESSLKSKSAELDYAAFLVQASDMYQSEVYPEAKALINQQVTEVLQATLDKYSTAQDAEQLLAAFNQFKKSVFEKANHELVVKLFVTAVEIDLAKARKDQSSDQLMAIFTGYGSYYKENPFYELVDSALDIDEAHITQQTGEEVSVSLLDKYIDKPLKPYQKARYQKLIGQLITQKLGQAGNSDELANALDDFSRFELNMANKKHINESILAVSGVQYRETFREGKIGERYVPAISRSESYNETRYINGVALNETKFNDYTTGGYDESRYGFTAVYQLFNESEKTYLVDVEISATISNTEYKKQSSWSGPDQNVEVKKSNLLVKKITYVLKSGSEIKDQIIVGEKKPNDFLVSIVNITPIDREWFDKLSTAMESSDTGLISEFFFDEKAKYWKPELAANLARHAYMKLDTTISTGDKFDRDFKSPVQLTFTNNNAMALKLTYSTNFTEGMRTVVVNANSAKTESLMAYGRAADDLEVTIEMLEAWK
ncbi:MAG: discoidin domain-containing protein [Alteromonadaceae bacterium]|nr:discoidin domain-containing protein [Alteromonadaceae bacterium]